MRGRVASGSVGRWSALPFDLAVAVGVGLLAQLEVWAPGVVRAGGNLHHVGSDVFNATAFAIIAAALVWRRRESVVVLGVVLCVLTVQSVAYPGYQGLGTALPLFIATYTAGRFAPRHLAVASVVAALAVLAIHDVRDPAISSFGEVSLFYILLVVTWSVGLVVGRKSEENDTLSRLLPGGVAEKLRREGRHAGDTETLDVTVLMSDIRGYTTIAEHSLPAALASQLNTHRAAMNRAILDNGGTVMQYVGDAVMAVFGAPTPDDDHPRQAVAAARAMQSAQAAVNKTWSSGGLPTFDLGIGLSTGSVAAALLGSDERLEYTLVGDTVNMAQRLQGLAEGGETVISEATYWALSDASAAEALEPTTVKGRAAEVRAYRLA